jgi:hypothetical protein
MDKVQGTAEDKVVGAGWVHVKAQDVKGWPMQGAREQHLRLWHIKRRQSYAHYAREDWAVRWH